MAYGTGMIDPMAPRQPPSPMDSSSEETPTADEDKLARQIDNLFEKAAKHRRKYDKSWVEDYRMFRGDQWQRKRPSYKHREVINLIFQTIQSQHSVMMDTRPTVGFLPQDPQDTELAAMLNQVFEADWQRHNWLDELAAVALDGHIYGVGHSYAGYDENLLGGIGGISFCCKDNFDMYPDPEATNVNKKSRWYVCATPEDIDTVKEKYAGHKYVNLIKTDLDDLAQFKRKVETLHSRKNTTVDLPADTISMTYKTDDDTKDKVLVVTAYMRPSDTEQIEKDDLQGMGDKIYITRLKYPRGRKVVKINNYIFEDGELEYDHLEFPYQRYVNYILPREYFGMSDINQTKGPQLVFNKLVNFALDVLTLMGNPVWKVPVEGNVNTRKMIAQPGMIIEYANGAEPRTEPGVTLQPYVFQLIDRMEKWFNDEAGTQDVTRGVNPTGVTANAAIENLLEAAQKRIKQKMRNLDSYLKDFGRQWVSLCFQYYTAPQIFRLTNNQGANSYFKFHVETRGSYDDAGAPVMGVDGQQRKEKFAIIRKYNQNDAGQHIPAETPDEYQIRGDFDVRVNTVSGLPFAKAENEQRVFQLFDRQIIDAEEVLKRLEYPNAEAIIQRMNDRQAAAAQTPEAQKPQGA